MSSFEHEPSYLNTYRSETVGRITKVELDSWMHLMLFHANGVPFCKNTN